MTCVVQGSCGSVAYVSKKKVLCFMAFLIKPFEPIRLQLILNLDFGLTILVVKCLISKLTHLTC